MHHRSANLPLEIVILLLLLLSPLLSLLLLLAQINFQSILCYFKGRKPWLIFLNMNERLQQLLFLSIYVRITLCSARSKNCHNNRGAITEVFGSTGFGNNGLSGVTDILTIPKLKISIKKAQSNGFSGITDKMASPNRSGTSENLCTSCISISYYFKQKIQIPLQKWPH